jgi:adenylosuccinate synthase
MNKNSELEPVNADFDFSDIYNQIQEVGNEFGVTTGRKRQIRFLDVNRLIKSINCTGTTHVVINKWDILEELDACCYFYNTNLFICNKDFSYMFEEVKALIKAYCKDVEEVYYSASKTNDIDWSFLKND